MWERNGESATLVASAAETEQICVQVCLSLCVCDMLERRDPLDCAPDVRFCTSMLFLVCFSLKVAHFAGGRALVGSCVVSLCVCVENSGSLGRSAPAPLCSSSQARPGVSAAAAVQGMVGQAYKLLSLSSLCRALRVNC